MVRVKGKVKLDESLSKSNILWRYLDTAKFLDFISNGNLYFNRADLFQDKYEGAFTQSIKHAIQQSYDVNNISFSYEEFKRKLRERVYINCWHKSPNDNMAMWQLYGQSNCSVAITTTAGKLESALNSLKLNHFVSLRKVIYVKHWRDPSLNIAPYSNVFAYKVVAYEYEKEVRAIIDRFDEEFELENTPSGMSIKVPSNKLLRSIVINPEAPQWYVELIKSVSNKFQIEAPVRRSLLTNEPV